jgi:hypothetical protein
MKVNNIDLKEYEAHVETIKQVARQSFGAAVVEECLNKYIPIFSLSLMMLHIQDPKKPLPDMEMVLFCMAKELSTIKPKKRAAHIVKQSIINSILDEALEMTLDIGIK